VKLDYATVAHTKLKCKTEALAFKLSAGNKERNRCCALNPTHFLTFENDGELTFEAFGRFNI